MCEAQFPKTWHAIHFDLRSSATSGYGRQMALRAFGQVVELQTNMADEGKQVSALLRRHQQLKRWEDSETNRESGSPRPSSKRVKFQDGCVFLAACSSGDKDEVKKLLDRGADINTANVDGLTALHQVSWPWKLWGCSFLHIWSCHAVCIG